MECLIAQIRTGELPSQSVVETLGALAAGNIKGTVPYLKVTLGLLVECIPMVKQESLKSAMCIMLSKSTEAILEAIENKDPDPNISLDSYVTESAAIFEALVNMWLKSSSANVRHETILCLAHLSQLLPSDKLEELAGLVVTTILSMYRRTSSPYSLTFSLALIMDALMKKQITEGLKFHVDHLLSSLFAQVCVSPSYTEPFTVKNHYEVLRCYDLLGCHYPENVVAHLLQRLENASYQQRVGALTVIKHLINSKTLSSENVASLVTTLTLILNDPNSKVVKSVTQVIVALCHNNHLTPQTGTPFITYLVKHSAGVPLPQARRPSIAEPEEESVPVVCRRVLHLLATTVEAAFPLLWPLLLTFVCTVEHEASLPTTLGCLAHLTQSSTAFNEEEPLLVGSPGPPTSPVLLSRLLVLSCTPGNGVGTSALTLLQGLAPHVSPRIVDPWQKHLPQLLSTYQDLSGKVDVDPSAVQVYVS